MLVVSLFSIMVGGSLNNRLVYRHTTDTILVSAWCFLTFISILPVLMFVLYDFHIYWLYTVMGIYFFGTAFLWPNLFSKAFAPFQHLSGQAGSLYGNAQTMGAFFAALLIGYASESNPYGLSTILVSVNILSLLIYYLAIVPHQQHVQSHT